jgi:hypothetical protein
LAERLVVTVEDKLSSFSAYAMAETARSDGVEDETSPVLVVAVCAMEADSVGVEGKEGFSGNPEAVLVPTDTFTM